MSWRSVTNLAPSHSQLGTQSNTRMEGQVRLSLDYPDGSVVKTPNLQVMSPTERLAVNTTEIMTKQLLTTSGSDSYDSRQANVGADPCPANAGAQLDRKMNQPNEIGNELCEDMFNLRPAKAVAQTVELSNDNGADETEEGSTSSYYLIPQAQK